MGEKSPLFLEVRTRMEAGNKLYKGFGLLHTYTKNFRTHSKMIRSFFVLLALIAAQSVSAGGNPIAHFLHKAQDSSYSEAYITTIAPTKLTVDNKALLRGLNTAKNCIGRLATFDCNEYAHFDNPLQLGFIEPPKLPSFLLRSKEKTSSQEATGGSRFDFWIPL